MKQYRYRLRELFIQRFGAKYIEAKENFARQNGWTLRTINRDCALTMNDAPIKRFRLQQYADFFDINICELKTSYEPAIA
ncbi:MAG: hypothetical protein KIS94_05705 [Chitinophagales bacterium]|nr:hypothetical protein [Chitinophagales bacterium]